MADTARVPVLSPDGKFGTVDANDAEAVVRAGGRVLGQKEAGEHEAQAAKAQAEQAVQERYDKLPTWKKAVGMFPPAAVLSQWGVTEDVSPPLMSSYAQGVGRGFTAGLSQVVGKNVREAIEPGGGEAYAQHAEDLRTASPVAHGVGEAAGFVGGMVAGPKLAAAGKAGIAARAIPSVGIGAAGQAVETGVGKMLAGVASRGAIGRAVATGAELGARGAVETGLYAGATHAADEVLANHDIAVDKLFANVGTGALHGFAGGAALGAAGSLATSGVRGGLARVLARRAEGAATAGEEGATTVYRTLGEGGSPTPAAPPTASKRLANELAFDALGATKTQARGALEHVKGGAQAVGEYVNRVAIAPAAEGSGFVGGLVKSGMRGRADGILEAIQADKAGRIAKGLEESTKATPARFNVRSMADEAGRMATAMTKDPVKAAGADAFAKRVFTELNALDSSGAIASDGTMDAAAAFQLRSRLAKQVYEVRQFSGAAGDEYKAFLRKWDDESIRAIDEAAQRSGKGGVGEQIRYWKREWQLASAAEEAAEAGAERYARNNTFGIRESIGAAAGLATGHPLGAAVTMVGGKILRERGSAMGAYVMNRVAERASMARVVQGVDKWVTNASRGLLQSPAKGIPKPSERMPLPREIARTALARVAEYRSDPERYIDRATRQVESLATHSPEIANALVARQVQAMELLASKVPPTPEPDPLAPHPEPQMTDAERASFAKYAWYTEKPERFFREVSRGKLTFEGAEVAQALMPTAFAELQERTMEALTERLAKGDKLPFRQRHLLGVLLDMATTPSQRPEHAAFLQANAVVSSESQPSPAAPARSSRPVSIPTQRSSYDRLEADGLGRR